MQPVPAEGTSGAAGESQPAATSVTKAELPGSTRRQRGQQLRIANAMVARVNEEVVTREDVLRDLRGDLAHWQETMTAEAFEARVREEAAQRLRAEIERRLVLQEARKRFNEEQVKYLDEEVTKERARHIAAGTGLAAWLAALEAQGLTEEIWRKSQTELLMIQALLKQVIEPQIAVTQDEMLAEYERVKNKKYALPGRARLQLIKLRLEDHSDMAGMQAVARSLIARARGGQDFGQLAKQFSKDVKAPEGGDWGFLQKGSFRVEGVDEALFTLPVGGVSDPIVDGSAAYVVRVAERVEARTIPFTEVQDECREAVHTAKRGKLIVDYLDQLYKKSRVEVYEGNL